MDWRAPNRLTDRMRSAILPATRTLMLRRNPAHQVKYASAATTQRAEDGGADGAAVGGGGATVSPAATGMRKSVGIKTPRPSKEARRQIHLRRQRGRRRHRLPNAPKTSPRPMSRPYRPPRLKRRTPGIHLPVRPIAALRDSSAPLRKAQNPGAETTRATRRSKARRAHQHQLRHCPLLHPRPLFHLSPPAPRSRSPSHRDHPVAGGGMQKSNL